MYSLANHVQTYSSKTFWHIAWIYKVQNIACHKWVVSASVLNNSNKSVLKMNVGQCPFHPIISKLANGIRTVLLSMYERRVILCVLHFYVVRITSSGINWSTKSGTLNRDGAWICYKVSRNLKKHRILLRQTVNYGLKYDYWLALAVYMS